MLSSVLRPVEISPKWSRSGFRPGARSDRLEIGIGDRLHPGIVTGIISECRPGWFRNRDRLAPESAAVQGIWRWRL